MTIPNPDYNPDWEIIHDYHHAQRTRLEKEMRVFHKLMVSDDRLYEELKREFEFHHGTCVRCLDTLQHETYADLSVWRIRNTSSPIESSFNTAYHEGPKNLQ